VQKDPIHGTMSGALIRFIQPVAALSIKRAFIISCR